MTTSPPPPTIRPLVADDLEMAPAWMREHGILPERWRNEHTRRLIAGGAAGESVGVGMMWTSRVHPGRYSATVVVAPDRRRRGVGSALVAALADTQPEPRSFIWGSANSDPAHAFVSTFTSRTIQRSPLDHFSTTRARVLRRDGRARSAGELPRDPLERAWVDDYNWTHAYWQPMVLDAAVALREELWDGPDIDTLSVALDPSAGVAALIAVYRDPDGPVIAGETTARNTPDGRALVEGCVRRALDELVASGAQTVVVDGHETDPHLMPVGDPLGSVSLRHTIVGSSPHPEKGCRTVSSLGPRPVRRAIAAALVALPGVAIPLTWMQWRSALPETLPVQWSGDEVTTSMPTAVLLIVTLLVVLGSAVWAVAAAITGAPTDAPRAPYLAGGSAAATATILWVISSGLAVSAFGATESPVGLIGLALIMSLLWGFVPFLVAGRTRDPAMTY